MQRECPSLASFKENRAPISTLPPSVPKGAMSAFASVSGISVGRNRLYTLSTRQNSRASPDVVTGMLRLFSHNVYCLLDLMSSLSNVAPYVSLHLYCGPESLSVPFSVSTLVEDSMVITRVYKRCDIFWR